MIIKARARAGGSQLAAYLLNRDGNERAEILEMRGLDCFGGDLRNALIGLEIESKEHAHTNPLYHVSFRLEEGAELTPEQWRECADRLEKNLKMEGNPRALVMHEENGEKHLHVVWSRMNDETGNYNYLHNDHYKCRDTGRELEREFGTRQLPHTRTQDHPDRADYEQAKRQGRDIGEIKAEIREAWERSDNGASFENALADAGYILAKGDKRDFVAVDRTGQEYTIGKRITGETAAQIRTKTADLDRDLLPSVDQAKDYQEQREQARAEREREEKQRAEYRARLNAAIEKAEREEKARRATEQQQQQPAQAEKEHGHDTPEPPKQAQENTPQPQQEKTPRPYSPPTIVDGQGRPLTAAYTFGPTTEREKWQVLTEQAHAKRDAAAQIRAAEALRSDDREDRQEVARYIEEAARAATRRDPSPDTKTRADEITQAAKDGQKWQECRHAPALQAKENAKPPNIAPEKPKEAAPNIGRAAGRAAGAIGDSVLRLADGLLGGLAGPVTHEQIRQQAAGTQQRTAEQVRDAAQQFQKPLTPQEREAKAREFDRAAAEATRARDTYRQAQINAAPPDFRRALQAEYRANHEAKEAAKQAALLRETEQQRQEREAKEREEREAERRRRERQRER